MKKLITLTLSMFVLYVAKADKIYRHSGDVIDCTVVAVENGFVKYSFKGETATNVLGKYAISKIVFDSGREQFISKKYSSVEADSVIVTSDVNEVMGLKEVETIRSSSNNDFNFKGSKGLDKKATYKLQKSAASKGAFIVLLTGDYAKSGSVFTTSSSTKRGVCYTY
jgi:hypothetical protein